MLCINRSFSTHKIDHIQMKNRHIPNIHTIKKLKFFFSLLMGVKTNECLLRAKMQVFSVQNSGVQTFGKKMPRQFDDFANLPRQCVSKKKTPTSQNFRDILFFNNQYLQFSSSMNVY